MAGLASTLVVSGLLAAAADPFSFEGPRARASTERAGGFFLHGNVPFTQVPEEGTGAATLEVQDRVTAERATYGDAGSLSATFRLGGTVYGVELTQVGFPPTAGVRRSLWHPVAGGVMLDRPLYGDSGVGFPNMTRTRAAAALWGVGRVTRNGQLLTDHAIIHAAALSEGAFADESSHALLSAARPGDTELIVLAWNLPVDLEPRGFIQFVFDDVSIEVQGQPVAQVAVVPGTSEGGVGTALGGASLGAAPQLAPAGTEQGTGGSGLAAEPSATTALPGGAPPGAIPGVVGPAGVALTGQLPSVPGTVQSAPSPEAAPLPASTPGVAVDGTVPQPVGGVQASVPAAAPALPATAEATPGVATTGTLPTQAAAAPVDVAVAPNPQPATPGVATTGQLPAGGDVQGFGAPPTAGAATGGTVSTIGGFTVVPLSPGSFSASSSPAATGPGSNDVPGNQREQSPGLPATPPPLGTNPATPPAPLPASPAPANAAPAQPLVATPAPLNAAPAASAATPFIATPAPLGQAAPASPTPAVPAR